jgi:molybdopterin synthase catalytic subunit
VRVEVRGGAFDAFGELQAHQAALGHGEYGALASFVGTMRDFNEDETVSRMVLEHYPGMTERHLTAIAEEALRHWDLLDVLVVHRVGPILPGDAIVLVAAWSAHRGAAFEACRYLIEELKHRAPFWKREETDQGSRWVTRNTSA